METTSIGTNPNCQSVLNKNWLIGFCVRHSQRVSVFKIKIFYNDAQMKIQMTNLNLPDCNLGGVI